ncbi:MAG: (deoxy)nucleoside triphosphate pyrophosphohydrolase [Gemmatimonadota bacterium]|nr:(deoxy)nucleoside triphosphate pyrophosphohydrolase [Gemmatimonadota bacterium]
MSEAAAQIALGVVVRAGRFLVQPRTGDPALSGLWELPGGKIEPGEDPRAALAREVAEETGLTVRVGELVAALCHRYPDRRVVLWAYRCEPVGGEAPEWARWVRPGAYLDMPIPEANGPIARVLERAPP